MPKFESPLGSKYFPNQRMRELDVPDETQYGPPPRPRSLDQNFAMDERAMREFQGRMQPPPPVMQQDSAEIERQIREAKRARVTGKERLSEGARRRVEMLVGMTRLTKNINIENQTYILQSLKSKELRDVVVAAAEFDGTVQFAFETRKQILARSLTCVAGVDIDSFLNSSELEDRLDFVDEMDHALLKRLYDEYVVLANEVQAKYSIKTEAEAKEVVEDLKK